MSESRSAKQQFIEWWNGEKETEAPPDIPAAPVVRDAGELPAQPHVKTAKEKFAEDLERRFAFDPSKDPDGWKTLV